jgi:type VI secretion system secreted protein Hcp
MAVVDMFMKIEGIEGESKDEAHKNAIDVLSFSTGLAQTGTGHTGGGSGAGKVAFQDFNFTKLVDKSSPKIALACAEGTHIPEAKLIVRKAGGTPLEYYTITLSDCLVSSVTHGGAHESSTLPTENVTLNFSKIQYVYQEQDAKGGKAGGEVKAGYNLKTNKKV